MPPTPEDDLPPESAVELEVPGTPEEVWQAIATGPGISAWFLPAEVDGREGGTVVIGAGSEGASTGRIETWEPPRRLRYVESWQPTKGTEQTMFATEFLVEARAGGTCVMRIVSSGFGDGTEWEAVRDSLESGWAGYLRNLRLYLTHFKGQPCAPFALQGHAEGTPHDAWAAALAGLGIEPREGARVVAAPGAPALAGVVETTGDGYAVVRVEQPAPGMVVVGAFAWSGRVVVTVQAYLFGDGAPAAAARHEPRWRAWMDERFPAAAAETA